MSYTVHSACLPLSLSVCLSVCLSIYLSIYLSISLLQGKEFETKLKDMKPGDISDDLRTALGMPVGTVSVCNASGSDWNTNM